jgi:ubiquinone/menaquinone biosynthesis C-methylase UbiE
MISHDGWQSYCIWEHSSIVKRLYERRAAQQEDEMTCAAQAADWLSSRVLPGDTLLDVGCGSGYFYHSLRKRSIPATYFGIDGSPSLIEIGRRIMPRFGLPPENLQTLRLEDLDGAADHVVCMNVLSNLDNYHRPLERLLKVARKTLVLRESLKDTAEYHYVIDKYLDDGGPLKVHVNAYPIEEVMDFIRSYGFHVTVETDERTQGQPENIIDHPHYWKFLMAERPKATD